MTITIYGASDDLIEVDGDLAEEFGYANYGRSTGGDLLGFSDGTLLRILHDGDGCWRITRLKAGTATFTLQQGDPDEEGTDRATLDGDIAWVVHGSSFTSRKSRR